MSEYIEKVSKIVDTLQSHPDKNVINAITKIAEGVSKSSTPGVNPKDIVSVVEKKTLMASSERRLSLLYLLDSILYNVKSPYSDLFQTNLPAVFVVCSLHFPFPFVYICFFNLFMSVSINICLQFIFLSTI